MTHVDPSGGPRPVNRARLVAAAGFAVPAAVLVACYAWLAVERGTAALWRVIVHESGRYTLGETVLYFAHFLREVPTDVAYALFVLGAGGALAHTSGTERRAVPVAAARARVMGWAALSGAILLVLGAVLVAARADGLASALRDLMQFRTRDDLVAYGSHWRFHWLSTIWFGAAVTVVAAVIARFTDGRAVGHSVRWERAAWGYVVVLTLVFGLSREVFADTRYVGHQAREILTHGPVTALVGIATVVAVRQWLGVDEQPGTRARGVWFRVGAMVVIPVYLGAVALTGDVMEAGQADHGLVAMVAAHYFEHTLDYLFTTLLVIAALGFDVAYRRTPRHTGSTGRARDGAQARRTP